jgi:hypothetical protein
MVDGPVPDTAMDTKSDEGEPGGEPDTTPLTADERELLERLRASGASPTPTPEADTLPGAPPPEGDPDPLDPIFREPNP